MQIDVVAEMAPDLSVVLLDADGQVDNDDDLVFWNAPAHPSGAVVIDDVVSVDTTAIPARVSSITVVLSTFVGCTGGRLVVDGTGYAHRRERCRRGDGGRTRRSRG